MSKNGILIIIALLLLAGISSWWQWSIKTDSPQKPDITEITSDYFLETFTIRDMNDQGRLNFILKGERLDFFEKTRSSAIKKPNIAFIPETKHGTPKPWTVTAETAQVTSNELEQMHFEQNVIMHRPAHYNQSAITIQSDSMTIQAKEETVESNSETTISMNNSTILAANMHMDIKNGLLNLTQVKSRVQTR